MNAYTIGAVVISYYPDLQLVQNVRKLLLQVKTIVIIDNTPDEGCSNVLKQLQEEVQVIRNYRNLGIATALNQGLEWAKKQNLQWLLTFDQDTEVMPDFLNSMWKVYLGYESPENVAVIGANYMNRVSGVACTAVIAGTGYAKVTDVITSGSLISVAVADMVGGFDDKLFIDMVDTDFCIRVRQVGYHVLITEKPLICHMLGNAAARNILKYRFYITNHASFRRYFIFRNTIYLAKKYIWFDFFWSLRMICIYLPKVFVKACFFEKRWKENILYIVKGVYDGIWGIFTRKVL